MGYQAVDSVAGFAWAFIVTAVLLFIIDKFPGLHLRASPEEQEIGMDRTDLGVGLYEHLDDICTTNGLKNSNNNTTEKVSVIALPSSNVVAIPMTPALPGTAPPALFQSQPNIIAFSTANGDMNGYGGGIQGPGSAVPNSFQTHYFIKNNGGYNNNDSNPNNSVMVMNTTNGYIPSTMTTAGGSGDLGAAIGMVGGEAVMTQVETTQHI